MSDLTGAVLRDAQLDGATVRETDLTKADLRGASLAGVDLREATLKETRLDLPGAVHLAELTAPSSSPEPDRRRPCRARRRSRSSRAG